MKDYIFFVYIHCQQYMLYMEHKQDTEKVDTNFIGGFYLFKTDATDLNK